MSDLERPEGKVDQLLGLDYAGYLPIMEKARDHLLLLWSHFGTGRLLSGRVEYVGVAGCDHILTAQAKDYGGGTKVLPANTEVAGNEELRNQGVRGLTQARRLGG